MGDCGTECTRVKRWVAWGVSYEYTPHDRRAPPTLPLLFHVGHCLGSTQYVPLQSREARQQGSQRIPTTSGSVRHDLRPLGASLLPIHL